PLEIQNHMKARGLIIVALAIQICLLIFVAIQAPEIDGAIQVGIKRLKEEAPSQAPSIQSRTDGTMELKTPGDFFHVAGREARIITGTTVYVTLTTAVILAIAFFTCREKTKTIARPQE